MRIQMLRLAAGPNGVRRANTQHDLPVADAAELVSAGAARLVDAADKDALDKALAKKTAPEKKQ